jgi:hypothetical protein
MAYSYVAYSGNGSTTQFVVPFGYIRKEHVYVEVESVNTTFTWVNATTIQLATAPASGAEVVVKRVTPVSGRLVDYSDASTLVAADMDTDSLQHLYTEQELTDSIGPASNLRAIYYGAYSADPVVDPFGVALDVGDLYYNSQTKRMRVWNGSTWEDTTDNVTLLRWQKTATAGLTSLSGADDNSQTLQYNPGLEQLYVNGAMLSRGSDYVATTGSSITGLAALRAGDRVEVLAFNKINTIGSIPAANVGFLQAGTGAVARTVESKLQEVVSVKDFGIGSGVTDDTAKLQSLLNQVSAAGGGEVLFNSNSNYNVSDAIIVPSNLVIRFTGSGFIKLTSSTVPGGVFIVQGTEASPAENVVIYNPQIDANNFGLPTGAVGGENGIGGTNCKNVKVFGGVIKNCKRGASAATGTGGKGIQFESGVEDVLVQGTTVVGCTVAMEMGGEPDSLTPGGFNRSTNVQYKDIRAINCERVISVQQTASPPDASTGVCFGQIDGVLAFNCGRESAVGSEKDFGAIVMDRASNVSIVNFTLANSQSYGSLGALIRQPRGTNCVIQASFTGNADALVEHGPGATGFGMTGTCESNSYDVHHNGTTNYLLNGPAGQGSALKNNCYNVYAGTVLTGLVNPVMAFDSLRCQFFSYFAQKAVSGPANAIVSASGYSNSFPSQDSAIAGTFSINGLVFSYGASSNAILVDSSKKLQIFKGPNLVFELNSSGIQLPALSQYANNAAAVAAGLPWGTLYLNPTGNVCAVF